MRVYFAIVLALVFFLGYETLVALQTEDDCRAGCALAIGAMVLTISTVVAGSLLALLSAWGLKRCRAFMANKRPNRGVVSAE